MQDLQGYRVLVVDDSEAERMLLSSHLHRQGCRVYVANDGLDAIDKAEILSPDIILLDAKMPECDGFHACKLLKKGVRTRHVPIIFISALTAPDERVEGLLAGAVDYINKPFNFEEIKLRLLVHLAATARPRPPDTPDEAGDPTPPASLDSILFQGARVHLLKSLASPPSLEELCRLTRTHKRRLNAAFQACAGATVYEYLREIRMQEAKRLLDSTSLSVELVALRIGFTSGPNFSTAFRERFGLSPSRYRNRDVATYAAN